MPAADETDRPPDVAPSRRRLRTVFALVALLGLVADQVTKVVAVRALQPGVGVEVLGPVLRLRLVRNPGAAFSLGEGFTVVFTVLAVVVLAFILVRLVPQVGHRGWAVALGLLVAGIAGNLADRLFRSPGVGRGHVVDFLQLPSWPIFNVADMCITSGAALVVVLSMVRGVAVTGERHPRPERPTAARPGAGGR